jgi:hypothetical protein
MSKSVEEKEVGKGETRLTLGTGGSISRGKLDRFIGTCSGRVARTARTLDLLMYSQPKGDDLSDWGREQE